MRIARRILKVVFIVTASAIAFIEVLRCAWHIENYYKMKEVEQIARKIDQYQERNGSPPKSLKDVGVKVDDFFEAAPFYYQQIDSTNYELSFVINLGESQVCYSEPNSWGKLGG